MALTPLSSRVSHSPVTPHLPPALTGTASLPATSPTPSFNDSGPADEAASLTESLERAKESSLLYQLIRSLLLRPEELPSTPDAGASVETQEESWAFRADSVFSESVQFTLQTEDGVAFEFSASQTIRIALEITQTADGWAIRLEQSVAQQINLRASSGNSPPARKDPLLLDLDGNGPETSGPAAPVRFDLDADGIAEWISAAAGGDAFLALDRNGNGTIDNGRELFGDQNGAVHGFAELQRFDVNADRVIDVRDPVFKDLQLLRWVQGQKQSASLAAHGIQSLSLQWLDTARALANGDQITQMARFRYADGREQDLADVWVQHWRA